MIHVPFGPGPEAPFKTIAGVKDRLARRPGDTVAAFSSRWLGRSGDASAVMEVSVLHTTGSSPVGIRGRESYNQRKRVKQAHHQLEGAELVEWDVTDSIPDVRRCRG